ncbi:Acyl carrier protein [Termitomyces sp. J132]|nr:hypothetical protein H2248_004038 [Termitomyces sp. 'cryptogamus']KNZ80890.1 Acyl carrier protein [Termitomyces sp. J132]
MDLASLGVDSLMLIELTGRLGLAFTEAHLNAHMLSFYTTVADIIREVSTRMCVKSTTRSDSPITVLSGASTPRTLFQEDAPSDLTQNEELDVKDILASVLGLATYDINNNVDFDSLGLDSLTSIEMLLALKNEFDLELPGNLLTT